jgi:hypothetical protein
LTSLLVCFLSEYLYNPYEKRATNNKKNYPRQKCEHRFNNWHIKKRKCEKIFNWGRVEILCAKIMAGGKLFVNIVDSEKFLSDFVAGGKLSWREIL